jgi:hypothetical protein
MGKHTASPIETLEAKAPACPALSNFSGVKTNRIQVLQFISQAPKKSRLPRTRRAGD